MKVKVITEPRQKLLQYSKHFLSTFKKQKPIKSTSSIIQNEKSYTLDISGENSSQKEATKFIWRTATIQIYYLKVLIGWRKYWKRIDFFFCWVFWSCLFDNCFLLLTWKTRNQKYYTLDLAKLLLYELQVNATK